MAVKSSDQTVQVGMLSEYLLHSCPKGLFSGLRSKCSGSHASCLLITNYNNDDGNEEINEEIMNTKTDVLCIYKKYSDRQARPRGNITFFMLNSAKHEIYSANNIVGILICISRECFMLSYKMYVWQERICNC